ncbi:MAG TPA: hypothetical protein VHV82_15515 [Sporichthyaceae bacterium]|jgi:hypothetical protein|nr:hypothetical protein [Sporichthyaceae bacterium]
MPVNPPTPSPRPAARRTSKLSWLRRHKIGYALVALVAVGGLASTAFTGHSTGAPAVPGDADSPAAAAATALTSCMDDPNVMSVSADPGTFVSTVVIATTIGGDEGPNLAQDESDDTAGQAVVDDFQRCATTADGPNGLVSVDASDGSVLLTGDY